jgi:hypothetical protein
VYQGIRYHIVSTNWAPRHLHQVQQEYLSP